MEEQIVQALFNCTQADSEIRKNAESFLDSIKTSAGFGVQLVQISFNQTYSLQIRQLSSILLKNQCKKWKDSTLQEAEKQLLKENLVKCLKLSVEESIRVQFEEIAYVIGRHDKSLDSILTQIDQCFSTDNLDEIYAGLNALFQLTKRYEYVVSEKRSGLKPIITRFFDKVLDLMTLISSLGHYSHLNLIVQIFWVSFYLDYFGDLVNESKLETWFEGFRVVLSYQYENIQITDHYEQETKLKDPKYQAMKWVSQILYRFFSRFHDYKAQINSNVMIGQAFTSKWAKLYLDQIVSLVFSSQSLFIPDITLNYYLKYLNQAVKHPATCEYLSSLKLASGDFVIPSLITSIITPTVGKTPYDEELWNENPIEYIRRGSDLSSVYYSACNASLDLLDTLCSHGYLQQFLSYLTASLANQLSAITKESLMTQVGSLSSLLQSEPALLSTIESMLSSHIFPELASPVGFLKARAVWVYAQFSSIPFSSAEHQSSALAQICNLVQDPSLPVKFEAAVCLPKVLAWDIAKARVQGEISGVLKIYLDMINEIDSEEVIEALEDIVTQYSEQVLPFAVDLCKELTGNFLRLVAREGSADDDDSAMAAVSVLNTIQKIVETVCEKEEEILKISLVVEPALVYALGERGSAFMDEALNILALMMYHSGNGALKHLMHCFKMVVGSLQEDTPYGTEKHEEIFPVLANFIAKYLHDNQSELDTLVHFLLSLTSRGTALLVLSCRLLICVFEHFSSKVSHLLIQILPKMFQIVSTSTSSKEKAISCQVVYMSLYSDPSTSLSLLESLQIFKPLLNYSLNNLKHVKEKMSRVQIIVALASLFPLIPGFSASLTAENSAALFKRLIELILIVESDDHEGQNEENEENQKSPFVDAEEFNQHAEEIINKIRGNFEDDDDDEEVLFETDADEFYDSVFEDFNYKQFVKAKLAMVEPGVLASLTSGVDEGQKLLLARII